MRQHYLPIYQNDTPLHSELQKLCAERLRIEGPELIARIDCLLQEINQSQDQLNKAQRLLHETNSAALLLSALDPTWIVFSDAAFEQVILPSRTSVSSALDTLTALYKERINNANS